MHLATLLYPWQPAEMKLHDLTPVTEFRLVARAVEVDRLLLKVGLRAGDGVIVDAWTDFFEKEVEQQPCFQVADLLVHVLGKVVLDGSDRARSRVLGEFDSQVVSPSRYSAVGGRPDSGVPGVSRARNPPCSWLETSSLFHLAAAARCASVAKSTYN